jgi:K+-transporting ATPase ATPase A chain
MVVLVLTAIAAVTNAGLAGLVTNSGPRGFTEILFAYASCMANNGQTMAGLNANSVFYNVTTTIAMLAGRYGLAALALALAGRFAAQRRLLTTAGTLPGDTPTFGALVFAVILLVGALCFFPALALGPIVEFFQH